MIDTCFLGANTPEGFRSEYATLQLDPRIRHLTVIKGGPGCGKSTLMKKAAARAEALGFAAERILCSSDPESLDGLVIPALGRAFVDGTAPHVVEPELCGCGANYLNLGVCYREAEMEKAAPALQKAKAANAACYVPAYGCLRAAGVLEGLIRAMASRADAARAEARLLAELSVPEHAAAEPGPVLRCFLDAFTPQGVRSLTPASERMWILQDSWGLGVRLLRKLAARWRSTGAAVWLAMDPLAPDQPMGVLCPSLGTGCLRSTPVFDRSDVCSATLRLDAAAEEELGRELLARLEQLRRRQALLLQQALVSLREAKERHDELEALCRPAVDFRAADEITRTVLEELSA